MDWTTLISLFSSDRTWTVVSALVAAVATVAAMIAIRQTSISRKQEVEVKRPYFTIFEPGIKKLPQSPPYRIQITLKNSGTHPAQNLTGRIIIFDTDLSKQPEFTFDFSIANDVPSDTPTPWYNDSLLLPNDVPLKYIALVIKYRDPILGRDHFQPFYMRWEGVRAGITLPDFVHVSIEDKTRLSKYVRKTLEGCEVWKREVAHWQ